MAEHTVTFESVIPMSKKFTYAFDRSVTLTDLEQILAEVRALTASLSPVVRAFTVMNYNNGSSVVEVKVGRENA